MRYEIKDNKLFMEGFCYRCKHDDPENDVFCEIVGKTMMYDIDDAGYPDEWQYGEDGQPVCIKFEPDAESE